jgi:hypothetical protein
VRLGHVLALGRVAAGIATAQVLGHTSSLRSEARRGRLSSVEKASDDRRRGAPHAAHQGPAAPSLCMRERL